MHSNGAIYEVRLRICDAISTCYLQILNNKNINKAPISFSNGFQHKVLSEHDKNRRLEESYQSKA